VQAALALGATRVRAIIPSVQRDFSGRVAARRLA